MDQRGLLTQLGQLQERVDLLQVNLQKVSSRTLSNSRTCNLEDRVTDLEEGPPPSEPTLTTDIFEGNYKTHGHLRSTVPKFGDQDQGFS